MLQQIYLLIVDADLLLTPKFHSTSRHYEKIKRMMFSPPLAFGKLKDGENIIRKHT